MPKYRKRIRKFQQGGGIIPVQLDTGTGANLGGRGTYNPRQIAPKPLDPTAFFRAEQLNIQREALALRHEEHVAAKRAAKARNAADALKSLNTYADAARTSFTGLNPNDPVQFALHKELVGEVEKISRQGANIITDSGLTEDQRYRGLQEAISRVREIGDRDDVQKFLESNTILDNVMSKMAENMAGANGEDIIIDPFALRRIQQGVTAGGDIATLLAENPFQFSKEDAKTFSEETLDLYLPDKSGVFGTLPEGVSRDSMDPQDAVFWQTVALGSLDKASDQILKTFTGDAGWMARYGDDYFEQDPNTGEWDISDTDARNNLKSFIQHQLVTRTNAMGFDYEQGTGVWSDEGVVVGGGAVSGAGRGSSGSGFSDREERVINYTNNLRSSYGLYDPKTIEGVPNPDIDAAIIGTGIPPSTIGQMMLDDHRMKFLKLSEDERKNVIDQKYQNRIQYEDTAGNMQTLQGVTSMLSEWKIAPLDYTPTEYVKKLSEYGVDIPEETAEKLIKERYTPEEARRFLEVAQQYGGRDDMKANIAAIEGDYSATYTTEENVPRTIFGIKTRGTKTKTTDVTSPFASIESLIDNFKAGTQTTPLPVQSAPPTAPTPPTPTTEPVSGARDEMIENIAFQIKDGDDTDPTQLMDETLQLITDMQGAFADVGIDPSLLTITSMKRSEEQNKKAGGADTSFHKIGGAIDIRLNHKHGNVEEIEKFREWATSEDGQAWFAAQGYEAIEEDPGSDNHHLHIEPTPERWSQIERGYYDRFEDK